MYVKIKVNNGSIVIYYAVKGEMRFPTGVKISKVKNKKGFFTDFDHKKEEVRNTVENYQKLNKIIKSWEQRANEVIDSFLATGLERPTADQLKKSLENWQQGQNYTYATKFLDAYDAFYNSKQEELVNSDKKSDESFKTYKTFLNTIKDFEAEHSISLSLNDTFNKKWVKEFDTWLQKERPKTIVTNGVEYKFKTKGSSADRTRDKRFEVFRSFVAYLKEEKMIENDDFLNVLTKYRKDNINITEKIKTTLTIDEIHKLYGIDFNNETHHKVVKLFLFACLTGFRWKDIEDFNTDFIVLQDKKNVYEYIASKTRNKTPQIAKVPLCKLAMKILKELNYKLDFVKNATANEVLKLALKETKLFNKLTFVIDSRTGRKKERWEIISMHRGRDTFITNLIGLVPLHELMVYTSHEKLSTLQGYIDKKRPINPDYVDIFDEGYGR